MPEEPTRCWRRRFGGASWSAKRHIQSNRLSARAHTAAGRCTCFIAERDERQLNLDDAVALAVVSRQAAISGGVLGCPDKHISDLQAHGLPQAHPRRGAAGGARPKQSVRRAQLPCMKRGEGDNITHSQTTPVSPATTSRHPPRPSAAASLQALLRGSLRKAFGGFDLLCLGLGIVISSGWGQLSGEAACHYAG